MIIFPFTFFWCCLINLQIKITPRQIQNDETAKEVESEENNFPKQCASLEELEKGKLPPEEILSLPMFKVLIKLYITLKKYS